MTEKDGKVGKFDLRIGKVHKRVSKEEALEEAHGFMELHRVHWPKWEGEIEIRLMYEAEDDVRATQIEGSRLIEQVGGA